MWLVVSKRLRCVVPHYMCSVACCLCKPVEQLVSLNFEDPQEVGLAMLAATTASLMCPLKGITLERQHEMHFLAAE